VRRGRRGDVVRIVGSNRIGLDAAAREAARLDVRVSRVRSRLSGESRHAGARLARRGAALRPGSVLLAGGETVVTLGPRAGRGGRTLELALAAAMALEGSGGRTLLASSSDGLDGSSGAAGAWTDERTIARARRRGLDPASALARHDTRAFFAAAGDLFVTGPTGGNVGDWVFLVHGRNPARRRPV
jgi:glycerate-2-kinase